MTKELQLSGRVRGALRALVPAALNISHNHGGDFEAMEREGLRADCYRQWPQEPQFIAQWNALLGRNPWATIFCSPAWQEAVANEFVPAGQFRLITVRRGDELLAVLPLALTTASMLETPGRWVTDYLDPLIDAKHAWECWAIILQLLEQLWDWSMAGVQLWHVRSDSANRAALAKVAPKTGFDYREKAVTLNPCISLPTTWDEYLAGLDGHERKEIKRKVRNAQTKGGARWVAVTDPDEMEPALERALAQMRQAESTKADFTEEILIGFLRRLCPQLMRRGDFFVQELWIENKPSAWLLGLPSQQGPMIYNTSYEFMMRQWSPGIVSFAMGIQDAIAAGHPVFNLLRGGEEYKKRLGAADRELMRITLRPK